MKLELTDGRGKTLFDNDRIYNGSEYLIIKHNRNKELRIYNESGTQKPVTQDMLQNYLRIGGQID